MKYSYLPKNNLNLDTQKKVEELTFDQFNTVVASPDYIIVIEFYTIWSLPCKNIAEQYESMSSLPQFKHAKFFRTNVNINDDTVIQCNKCELPTFQFYHKGEKLGQVVNTNIHDVSRHLLGYIKEYISESQ